MRAGDAWIEKLA